MSRCGPELLTWATNVARSSRRNQRGYKKTDPSITASAAAATATAAALVLRRLLLLRPPLLQKCCCCCYYYYDDDDYYYCCDYGSDSNYDYDSDSDYDSTATTTTTTAATTAATTIITTIDATVVPQRPLRLQHPLHSTTPATSSTTNCYYPCRDRYHYCAKAYPTVPVQTGASRQVQSPIPGCIAVA